MSTMLLAALLLQTDSVSVEQHKIIMVTQATCGPCQQWKSSDHPTTLTNAGWAIEYQEYSRLAHPNVSRIPHFIRIVPGKEPKTFTGYTTAIDLMGAEVVKQPEKAMVEYQGQMYDANSYQRCGDPGCTMCPYILGFKTNGAPQAATPDEVITKMLGHLNLKRTSVIADLGCGDGRILVEAVKRYNCYAVGVEIDDEKFEEAVFRVKEAGLEDRITLIKGDAREFCPSLYGVTAIVAFQYDDLLKQLKPVIEQVPNAATPFHKVPGLPMTKVGSVWLYRG